MQGIKKLNRVAINSLIMTGESSGGAPEWLQLLPAGQVIGRDGRVWMNGRPETIVEFCRNLGRDLPIDIEHATELKGPKGEPAPAVGWIRTSEIEARNGEIWGRVEWTEAGGDLVDKKAYRYLSPVIIYEKESNVVVGLTSVALTNQPNLRLQALNNQQGGDAPKEHTMWKLLLAALALPETATEQDAVVKVKSMQSELATAMNRADNPSLEKFVPRADHDAALARARNAEDALVGIKKEQLEKDVDQAIEQALADGKITPATADYHKAQCRQEGGLELFKAYCTAAPVIGGDSGLGGKKPEQGKALNAQEKEICDRLGISHEEYLKTEV